MSHESPTWKHDSITRSLEKARTAVSHKQPILLYLYDEVRDKKINALAYYDPESHHLIVEGPAEAASRAFTAGDHFPIGLHTIEALYQTLAAQEEKSFHSQPPQVTVSSRGEGEELYTRIRERAHQLVRLRLTVRPHAAHRIIFHKGARSQHINVEQVIQEYTQWLWRVYETAQMPEFPVHALLSFRPNGSQPASKNEVQFKKGVVDDPQFNILNSGRIKWAKGQHETL